MVDTELIQGHTPLDYTKESVKLTKNSKGFTWEIKIIGTEANGLFTDSDLKRLSDLNEKLNKEYGKEE